MAPKTLVTPPNNAAVFLFFREHGAVQIYNARRQTRRSIRLEMQPDLALACDCVCMTGGPSLTTMTASYPAPAIARL